MRNEACTVESRSPHLNNYGKAQRAGLKARAGYRGSLVSEKSK